MWKLVRLSLAYHRKTLLWALVIALLLSKFGLVVVAFLALAALSAEGRERRLLLHLPLPVTRTQVAWARVVFPNSMFFFPAAIGVLGALVAVSLAGADTAPMVEAAARENLFFAAVLMFFLQLLLMMGELQVWAGGRFGRTLEAGVFVIALLGMSLVIWVELALFGSHLVVAFGMAGLTLGFMGFTVYLFHRRRIFQP
jgi:hypothetical protein